MHTYGQWSSRIASYVVWTRNDEVRGSQVAAFGITHGAGRRLAPAAKAPDWIDRCRRTTGPTGQRSHEQLCRAETASFSVGARSVEVEGHSRWTLLHKKRPLGLADWLAWPRALLSL